MQDKTFTLDGSVTTVEPLQGSFCTVHIEHDNGDFSIHTAGLDDNFCFPRAGDRIRIFGVIRNGNRLTNKWKKIRSGV